MVKRIIPDNMSPWECEINGVKYVYPPGTEQMVTEEVAHVIDAWYASQEPKYPEPEVPEGGGGSGADLLNEFGIIKQEYLPDGYPYQAEVALYREVIASMTDDGHPITQPLGLVIGNTYSVEWNGTIYSCLAEGFDMDGVTVAVLGDTDMFVTGEPTGACPFVLMEMPSNMVENGVYAVFMPLDGTVAGTLVVGGGGIIPIDRKLLPEGYPYVLEAGIVALKDTELPEGEGGFVLPVALNKGATYKVTWNGTEYTVAPQTPVNDLGVEVCWGNAEIFGLTNSGEPFLIVYSESLGWCVMALDGSAAPTVKIVTEKSYIPFDKRYMPGGGGLNLVNGTATGSLIGVSARKESDTYSIGRDSIAVGSQSAAAGSDAFAFGYQAVAEGNWSFAFGNNAKATGINAFAAGDTVTASGMYSHAEGFYTTASGLRSAHAEGYSTMASGNVSHAEGSGTTASGSASHAEGGRSVASGDYSHAEGRTTIAASANQHVQGIGNIEDADGKYAHIVGNGSIAGNGDVTRSNAHTLDWEGNAWFAGSVEGTALILPSPGGKRFSITVDDSGSLTAEEIAEE